MDCGDVRKRLSEYVDGMLSEAEVSAIEAHLDSCPDCSEAYESTSKVVAHMGRLESVDEPDGFLESVNARLDRRISLKGLTRRLFLPLRIKLPLELAGIAAAAVLVLYVSGMGEGRSQYEITVLLDERPVLERSEDKGVERGESREYRGKKGDQRGTERGAKRERRGGPGRGAEKAAEGEAETEVQIRTSLESLVSSLNGQVVSSEYREGTSVLTSMIVEMRADSFQPFLSEMECLGLIFEPPSRKPEDSRKLIRVRITVEYAAPSPQVP